MLTNPQPPQIHLPKGWQDCVQSAVLHAIALAHYAIVYARAWAADSINARVRLAAENDRLHEACALLHEELRIKDIRITQITPQRRPHYGPHERMAILELRAARGWSLKLLESAIANASAAPEYIICDKGQQFWCDAFKAWCDDQGITPRFGTVGQHGSIALVERFILTLKNECTRIILVPLRREAFHRELRFFEVWFNQHRPHSALDGKTPYEMYHEISPACERPRYEPRARWPRSAPCASPHAPVASHCGAPIRLDVRYHWGRKHLPIVELRRAA